MSSTAAPTEPGGRRRIWTSSCGGRPATTRPLAAAVDPHAAPLQGASSPSPHLATDRRVLGPARTGSSVPPALARGAPVTRCRASPMACARRSRLRGVRCGSSSRSDERGAGGRVGLYRGTSRRLWVSRDGGVRAAPPCHAARGDRPLTALAAAANALAQLALHLALLASGTSRHLSDAKRLARVDRRPTTPLRHRRRFRARGRPGHHPVRRRARGDARGECTARVASRNEVTAQADEDSRLRPRRAARAGNIFQTRLASRARTNPNPVPVPEGVNNERRGRRGRRDERRRFRPGRRFDARRSHEKASKSFFPATTCFASGPSSMRT